MNRKPFFSFSLGCSAALAAASLLPIQDEKELRCRSLEVVDDQGQVAMRLHVGGEGPEVRFFPREGPDRETRITSTQEGLVIQVGSAAPILLGHTLHGDGRRTLGLHVGDEHEVSLGVSEGRAGLTLKEQAKSNFIRLVADASASVLALGSTKSSLGEPSEQVFEGIALVGGNSEPSLSVHGSNGAERARIALTEDGGSMVRVSQQDGRGFAGLHTKGQSSWCGTGVVEDGRTQWSASIGFDSSDHLGLLVLGGVSMAGEARTRGIQMRCNEEQSTIEMRDRSGKRRLHAAASDQEESLTFLDPSGTPMGGITRSEEMVGIGFGGPAGPSATLGIWKDRLRFLARDQGNVERLGFEIDPDRKATVLRRDEQGRVLEDGK